MDWWNVSGYSQDKRDPDANDPDGTYREYPNRGESSFSPKAAAVFRPFRDTTIRLTGGRAFNAPSIYQLFVTTNIGHNQYMANPDLKPETAWSWDMSVNQLLWTDADITLGYFENRMENLISGSNIAINSATYARGNVGKARSRGMEIEFRQPLGEHIIFAADYTYTDSKIIEDRSAPENRGNRLSYVPAHLCNVNLEGRYGPASVWIGGRYVSKRYGGDNNSDFLNNVFGSFDPVFTADTRASYNFRNNLSASFSVNNLFDRNYYDGSYIAPGRSFFISLAYRFGKYR